MATEKMYRLFSIVPRKGKKDLWLNLGSMFAHGDGKGFNILLQSLPLQTGPGEAKLVARELDEKEAQGDDVPEPDHTPPPARNKK